MNNPYWEIIKNDIPRFLGQLDTHPMSPAYGSFDRSFWHLRRSDFSSAALQQGSLVLACLYSFKFDGNSMYKSGKALALIEASLKYTFQIQHKDGSLDEWYPEERGWAGPTGYVLYSVMRTLELVGDLLNKEVIEAAKIFAIKAVDHLLNYEERDVLSNHQAMALLAIGISEKYFNLEIDTQKKKKCWNHFNDLFSDEGWSLEYDGCDPGYQTATLSFLSRLYRCQPTEEVKTLCNKQIQFLNQFIFPDLSFAGSVGSRGTANIFHFGFEFWSDQNKLASYLSALTLAGVTAGVSLRPCDQEDHYLIYRLVEFLEAAEIYKEKQITVWEQKLGNIFYKDSGILIISNEKYYGAMNLKKKASGKVYDRISRKCLYMDSGYYFKDTNGNKFTSSYVQNSVQIDIKSNVIEVSGTCNEYRKPIFTHFSFWLFRSILFFTKHSKLALLLKSWIRSKVMTHFAETKKITINRKISISPNFFVKDKITICNISIKNFYKLNEYPPRTVPQSMYFTRSSLSSESSISYTQEKIDELNKNKETELIGH